MNEPRPWTESEWEEDWNLSLKGTEDNDWGSDWDRGRRRMITVMGRALRERNLIVPDSDPVEELVSSILDHPGLKSLDDTHVRMKASWLVRVRDAATKVRAAREGD